MLPIPHLIPNVLKHMRSRQKDASLVILYWLSVSWRQSYARMASAGPIPKVICWLEISHRGNTFIAADSPVSMFGNCQPNFQVWRCIFCRCISVYTGTHFCKISEVFKIVLTCAYAIKINNPESFA